MLCIPKVMYIYIYIYIHIYIYIYIYIHVYMHHTQFLDIIVAILIEARN
jgi:hypothetical protein